MTACAEECRGANRGQLRVVESVAHDISACGLPILATWPAAVLTRRRVKGAAHQKVKEREREGGGREAEIEVDGPQPKHPLGAGESNKVNTDMANDAGVAARERNGQCRLANRAGRHRRLSSERIRIQKIIISKADDVK